MGALRRGHPALRAGRDDDRARRSHSAARRIGERVGPGAVRRRQGAYIPESGLMRLPRLQRAFADYVLSGTETIREWVRPSSKADIDTLLAVYRHAYSARLVEVLGNDFPGLKALAGAEPFDSLARAYIAAHPSRGFSVRTAGRS